MSVASQQKLDIQQTMKAQGSSALFVTSAGNRPSNLDRDVVYPAFYGKRLPNIIVVGAHDAVNDLVPDTAVGPLSVDLVAPGCKIPSIVSDKYADIRSESGTSQAAAYVSYAAGLIAGFVSEMDSSSVKMRILLTVDRDDKLKFTRSRGKLNVPKAIAGLLDVVDVRQNGNISTKYGVIDELSNRLQFCQTPADALKLSDVGRVDLVSLPGDRLSVRVTSSTGDVTTDECSLETRGVFFKEYISPGKLKPATLIPFRDITQIIPMIKPIDRIWQRGHVETVP